MKENIFVFTFWVLSWDSCNKRKINKRKKQTNKSLYLCIHERYPGENEYLRLKYHFQLNTKEKMCVCVGHMCSLLNIPNVWPKPTLTELESVESFPGSVPLRSNVGNYKTLPIGGIILAMSLPDLPKIWTWCIWCQSLHSWSLNSSASQSVIYRLI